MWGRLGVGRISRINEFFEVGRIEKRIIKKGRGNMFGIQIMRMKILGVEVEEMGSGWIIWRFGSY